MSFFISLYKTNLCIILISILFYSIISKRKQKDGKRKAGKKCKWLVGTHEVANGNDFNDYGNTYQGEHMHKNIVFDYIMMNDDDCIIDG